MYVIWVEYDVLCKTLVYIIQYTVCVLWIGNGCGSRRHWYII